MSNAVKMLNDPGEHVVCREMMEIVRKRIATVDADLLGRALDRDTYNQRIGARQHLSGLLTELEHHMQKRFNI